MEYKTNEGLPRVTVMMISYNRPLFLREAIPSLCENAGIPFRFIVWDNNSNKETVELLEELHTKYPFELLRNIENIGHQALYRMFQEVTTEFCVITEDDMIWFSPDWLKRMVEAMENNPIVTEAGKELKVKDTWGALATNVLVDKVNNGGMWADRFKEMVEIDVNGIWYWANVRAGAGAIIFRTKVAQAIDAINLVQGKFNNTIDILQQRYNDAKYPMGHVRDVYCYHAASPFWNQLYPKVWNEKQGGKWSIKKAMTAYKNLTLFDPSQKWLLQYLKDGYFKRYAEKLYKVINTGRGGIYSFLLERLGREPIDGDEDLGY